MLTVFMTGHRVVRVGIDHLDTIGNLADAVNASRCTDRRRKSKRRTEAAIVRSDAIVREPSVPEAETDCCH
jgi:hypothetical protein